MAKCIACNGSGYYDTTNSPKCSSCNGTGLEQSSTKPHPYKYVRFWHSNVLNLELHTKDMSFDSYVWDRMKELSALGIDVISAIIRDEDVEEACIRIECSDEEYKIICDLYSKGYSFDYYPPNHVETF